MLDIILGQYSKLRYYVLTVVAPIQILQIADTQLHYSEYIVNGSRGNPLYAFLPDILKNWGGNSDDRYLCLFVARVFMENCVHSLVLTKTNAYCLDSKH